ncbi:MAG TPA: DotI/IcmL family type IV secretion protein, partial [Alphaproteobacteria bacterium]|nr:DotI/IcmL family type IV secretion protein [Alphaproteobacteria bacterium]
REIGAWLTNSLSEAMTFDKGNHKEMLKADEKYFNETGKVEYLKFLADHNIMKVIESEKFDVRSFVQGQPLLLNEGAVNGVYRWLYEVPMMVSYMERGAKSYKDLEPVNQQLVLTVQVGRVSGVMDGTAILIERWSGKSQHTLKTDSP